MKYWSWSLLWFSIAGLFSVDLCATDTGVSAEPITPCNTEDPGFGIYDPWFETLPMGRILIPQQEGISSNNEFDLIIHFHGSGAIRKEFVKVARGTILVGIDLGAGSSAYQRAFTQPEVFPQLLSDIETTVAGHRDLKFARIRKLALTGWSAGYGAIREILRQRAGSKVDAVVLIDGLHADYDVSEASGIVAEQMLPFVRFAKQAAKGKKYFYVSHTKILPPGYASTTETAHYLVNVLRGSITKSLAIDTPYLSRYEQAKIGNFLMRGYLGENKYDHCAAIGVMPSAVATLEKRWKTPPASARGS